MGQETTPTTTATSKDCLPPMFHLFYEAFTWQSLQDGGAEQRRARDL